MIVFSGVVCMGYVVGALVKRGECQRNSGLVETGRGGGVCMHVPEITRWIVGESSKPQDINGGERYCNSSASTLGVESRLQPFSGLSCVENRINELQASVTQRDATIAQHEATIEEVRRDSHLNQ